MTGSKLPLLCIVFLKYIHNRFVFANFNSFIYEQRCFGLISKKAVAVEYVKV